MMEALDILPEDITLLKSVEKVVASVSVLPGMGKTGAQVSKNSQWAGGDGMGESNCQAQ